MQKFMCTHTFAPNSLTRSQCEQVQQASQNDPDVHGVESFLNLSEGKAVCIIEARNESTLADWFKKIGMPYDDICAIELEGNQGRMIAEYQHPQAGLSA